MGCSAARPARPLARSLGAVLALSAVVATPRFVAAQAPPTLTPADYAKWEALGAYDLDPTGRWLAASIRRVDESVEVRLRRSAATGEPLVLAHATGPVFAAGGRWLAYLKGVSPAETAAAEKAKKPVRNRLGLVDLSAGTDTVLFEARAFAFSEDGRWLAAHGYAAADTVGADLAVMEPATGALTLLGNVEAFAWQDEAALLEEALENLAFVDGTRKFLMLDLDGEEDDAR